MRATLRGDTEQRARQAAFADQIDAAHRDYVRWDKLRALIGVAGIAFGVDLARGELPDDDVALRGFGAGRTWASIDPAIRSRIATVGN